MAHLATTQRTENNQQNNQLKPLTTLASYKTQNKTFTTTYEQLLISIVNANNDTNSHLQPLAHKQPQGKLKQPINRNYYKLNKQKNI